MQKNLSPPAKTIPLDSFLIRFTASDRSSTNSGLMALVTPLFSLKTATSACGSIITFDIRFPLEFRLFYQPRGYSGCQKYVPIFDNYYTISFKKSKTRDLSFSGLNGPAGTLSGRFPA
jgi:hypothetical protein